MARRKKPKNETEEQIEQRLLMERISNVANRSEKTAWKRKLNNMEKLLDELRPIEEKIITIIAEEKQPMLDKIAELRTIMVNDCVHPYEHLCVKDVYVECKFCNKKLKVPDGS